MAAVPETVNRLGDEQSALGGVYPADAQHQRRDGLPVCAVDVTDVAGQDVTTCYVVARTGDVLDRTSG
ncbi:hypothetical protein OEB94_03220 [Streptomyces sp. ICN988]|uniref:hypothetical protein n=1 Tax=Streptomyces sp. ICN988 TaxID=2983765 RepID=UPI0021E48E45|nr:hypothetical protein [Streptomyces sp. ICN988]MCV2458293.1 hypothetical protein [Streptomyces sp. ICN988]